MSTITMREMHAPNVGRVIVITDQRGHLLANVAPLGITGGMLRAIEDMALKQGYTVVKQDINGKELPNATAF